MYSLFRSVVDEPTRFEEKPSRERDPFGNRKERVCPVKFLTTVMSIMNMYILWFYPTTMRLYSKTMTTTFCLFAKRI